MIKDQQTTENPTIRRRWPLALRLFASACIFLYLLAVALPPLAGPPPASELANVILQPFRPLVGALSLSHGYRFFAPNPGPGHSIRWTLMTAGGRTLKGVIPDAETDWPRLLYHRRFMIPEKIAALVPPPLALVVCVCDKCLKLSKNRGLVALRVFRQTLLPKNAEGYELIF